MTRNQQIDGVSIQKSAYVETGIELFHRDPSTSVVALLLPALRMTGHFLVKGRRISFLVLQRLQKRRHTRILN